MRIVVFWVGVGALLAGCGGTVTSGVSNGQLGEPDAGATGGSGGAGGASGTGPGGSVGRGPGGAAVSTGGRMYETGGAWPGGAVGVAGSGYAGGYQNTGGTPNWGGAIGIGGSNGNAGAPCVQVMDGAQVAISGRGALQDGGAPSSDVQVSGRVTLSAASDLTIDSCPALADCNSYITNVSVTAPGLDLRGVIPVGSLVSMHYTIYCPLNCMMDLVVTSLNDWGGYTNPTPAQSGLYLAVDDGGGWLDQFPIKVERLLLDCGVTQPNPTCADAERAGLYAFNFVESSGNTALVAMGDTAYAALGAGTLSARNLRSYATGWCDDSTNWSFWIANSWAP